MLSIAAGIKRLTYWAVRHGLVIEENLINRFYEISQLKQLLDELNINCVLDVGANVGQYAKELRLIGYEGHIFSFEPIPEVFDQMQGSLSHDPRWRGYCKALGRERATTTINYIRDQSDFSSILQLKQDLSNVVSVEIEVDTVDHVFEGLLAEINEPRVFLKMDTQGYDLEVFAGARDRIPEILGLQTELSIEPLYDSAPGYVEALGKYDQAGFTVFHISKLNPARNRALVEVNCFMRRKIF
jgi:FkbM family methyltransferase